MSVLISQAGLAFYVVIQFILPLNTTPVSRIYGYYRKDNIVIRIQSKDYYGNILIEDIPAAGEGWKAIQDMHSILSAGGWENIIYLEEEESSPASITLMLAQTKKLYEQNYYGVLFIQNHEKDFVEYGGSDFKDDVLTKLDRLCQR